MLAGCGAVRLTYAVPDFAGLETLVATIEMFRFAVMPAGAVYSPEDVILPTGGIVLQVTCWFDVPIIEPLNC